MKILVIGYSQTGQLDRVVDSITAPLEKIHEVDRVYLRPSSEFLFPWNFWTFFDTMPECVAEIPIDLEPVDVTSAGEYDVAILAYQPWFLSPSLPVMSFVKSVAGRRLLDGLPVIEVIGCRNMWTVAQDRMRSLLQGAGARVIDTVVLCDQSGTFESFITTPRWMLTGRKEGLGLSPAGISEENIRNSVRFGEAIAVAEPPFDASILQSLHPFDYDADLAHAERIGRRVFEFWSGCIRRCGKPGAWRRRPAVALFVASLFTSITVVLPIRLTIVHGIRGVRGLLKRG